MIAFESDFHYGHASILRGLHYGKNSLEFLHLQVECWSDINSLEVVLSFLFGLYFLNDLPFTTVKNLYALEFINMVETCEKIKVFSNSWPDPTKTNNEPAVKSDSHRAIATLI